jgi:S1-C subfamily serine protease
MRLDYRLWCVAVAGLALQACAPRQNPSAISYLGTTYANPAEALDAERSDITRFVAGITREPDSVRGSVLVVLPDHDRLRPLVAQIAKRNVYAPGFDLYVDAWLSALHANADALVKSGAFESATVKEQNDTRNPDPGSANYLVWYEVRTASPDGTGAWLGRWQFRRAQTPETVNIVPDPGVANGTARLQDWAHRVRQAALGMGGLTVAGHGAEKDAAGGGGVVASGTGIVLDRDGDVLTDAHVVAGCEAPRIVDAANRSYEATIVARDTTNDLALLKAPTAHWQDAAVFGNGGDRRPGESVIATGYPYGARFGSDMAVTTGSLMALSGPGGDSRLIEMTAPTQPGNSGGPLLDDHGDVIGIVKSTLVGNAGAILAGMAPQNVNFATKSTVIESFLDAHMIAYSGPKARPLASAADIGAEARKFTVRVECER